MRQYAAVAAIVLGSGLLAGGIFQTEEISYRGRTVGATREWAPDPVMAAIGAMLVAGGIVFRRDRRDS